MVFYYLLMTVTPYLTTLALHSITIPACTVVARSPPFDVDLYSHPIIIMRLCDSEVLTIYYL